MDWLVRSLFGQRDSIEVLPGLVMRVVYETIETTTGMVIITEKFKVVCDWFK